VETLGLVGVFVPGVVDEFLDLIGGGQIDLVDFIQLAVEDDAARKLEAVPKISGGDRAR
jgi:hypothetical protein